MKGNTMENVKPVAEFAKKLADAYSTNRYVGGWSACIKKLRARGLNDREIEAVIRSKWTRWAADSSEKPYTKTSASDLIKFMDADNMWKEVPRLTEDTFS
jgi:hypothetical protein